MELPYLPLDILTEILARLPPHLIGKSRLLSKEWNHTTYDSCFKALHAQRTGISCGFLLQSLRHNKNVFSFVSAETYQNIDFSLDFLPGQDPKIQAVASHGLMLCETQNPNRHRVPIYCICKPMIEEWKQLPNPRTRYFTIHTAMAVLHSNPLRFKIVRLSKPNASNERRPKFTRVICEVFDSGTWRWSRLEDVILPVQAFFLWDPAVSASGAVHWRLSDKTIFGFRLDEERWSRFALPDPMRMNDGGGNMRLAEYEGKLAFMCMAAEREASMEVWVMEQYRRRVWNKRLILTNKALKEELYHGPMAFYSSDIAVMWVNQRVIYSNFKRSSCSVSGRQGHLQPKIFPFCSDFEPCTFFGKSQYPPKGQSKKKMSQITDAEGDGSHADRRVRSPYRKISWLY